LLAELHELWGLENRAHGAGPEHPATWGARALVYSRCPPIVAELTFLENAHAAPIIRFLEATPEQRQAIVEVIQERSGMVDGEGKLVEVLA
jgi:hypothetical protein